MLLLVHPNVSSVQRWCAGAVQSVTWVRSLDALYAQGGMFAGVESEGSLLARGASVSRSG